MPSYVGMSMTPQARDAVRWLVHAMTGRLLRRAEISETLLAVCELAKRHETELVEIMKENAR